MVSKALAAGVLAVSCVGAAAGGAYLAIRHNNTPVASAVATAPADHAGSPGAATPAAQDTEAVVTPQPAEAPVALERSDRVAPVANAAPEPRAARINRAPAAETPAATRPASKPAARTATPPQPPFGGTAGPAPAASEAPAASPKLETAAIADQPVEAPRPEPPPAPPARVYDELVIPSSSVIGLQIETPVSSERARVEDRVEARVLRDVAVDGRTAVPAGTRAIGAVTLVERGGKVKERARLGVRFHTLVLADGTELPMRTDTILREGDSPAGESARKIGGAAAGGAILGAIIGGKKGAIVGGATGAAGGSAIVMAGDRNAATLPVGAVVTVRLAAPVSVEVERR
jgi:hypothetical protein